MVGDSFTSRHRQAADRVCFYRRRSSNAREVFVPLVSLAGSIRPLRKGLSERRNTESKVERSIERVRFKDSYGVMNATQLKRSISNIVVCL